MRGRNKNLTFSAMAQKVEEESISLAIQLAGDIIQKQNGREVVALFKMRNFGDLHRQDKRAVLTLTRESLYISAIYAGREVVSMRAHERITAALLIGACAL